MQNIFEVNLEIDSLYQNLELILTNNEEYELTLGSPIERETYTGPTRVIPSQEEQVLKTTNTVLLKDIIIEKIPQNYGLITWDGSILTIS